MVSRSLLAFCAIGLFFAVASANEVKVDVDDVDEVSGRGAVDSVVEFLLKQLYKFMKKDWEKVDKDCLHEYTAHCRKLILHPINFNRCVKNYLPEHDWCYGKK